MVEPASASLRRFELLLWVSALAVSLSMACSTFRPEAEKAA